MTAPDTRQPSVLLIGGKTDIVKHFLTLLASNRYHPHHIEEISGAESEIQARLPDLVLPLCPPADADLVIHTAAGAGIPVLFRSRAPRPGTRAADRASAAPSVHFLPPGADDSMILRTLSDLLRFGRLLRENARLRHMIVQREPYVNMGKLSTESRHDLKNLLSGIVGQAELDLRKNSETRFHRTAIHNGEKAHALLSAFSEWETRNQENHVCPFFLSEAVEEVLALVSAVQAGSDTEIRTAYNAAKPVRCNKSQILQLLLTLFLNTIRTCPPGETILVSTHTRESENRLCATLPCAFEKALSPEEIKVARLIAAQNSVLLDPGSPAPENREYTLRFPVYERKTPGT